MAISLRHCTWHKVLSLNVNFKMIIISYSSYKKYYKLLFRKVLGIFCVWLHFFWTVTAFKSLLHKKSEWLNEYCCHDCHLKLGYIYIDGVVIPYTRGYLNFPIQIVCRLFPKGAKNWRHVSTDSSHGHL